MPSLLALKDAKAELKKLEKRTAATLAAQKRTYQRLARNKAAAAAIIREAAAKQKRLAKKINALIKKQVNRGNIPSEFNGTMRWPMDSFSVSGDYGCSSFEYYAPGMAAPLSQWDRPGRPEQLEVKAAAAGTVVYVGWNWADGPDPAWIVVIALEQREVVVRPHATDPAGLGRRARLEGRGHRHPGAPGTPRVRTCTGWSSSMAAS